MSATDITLRAARESDGPAIGAIKVEAWRRAYGAILPAAVLDGLDVSGESAEWGAYAQARPPDDRLIVACRDGAVIGYGRSEPCPDPDVPGAGEVAGLYVRPAAQGQGVGTAMLGWLAGDLAARGFDPIVLWHFVGNRQAAAVYARFGFHPDGARRPVPGLEVDEVRLRLAHPVG
jgi:GNAT superfamily N-acetyltransferase